jgi:hypothetical protein
MISTQAYPVSNGGNPLSQFSVNQDLCPNCGIPGQKVKNITVRHLVNQELEAVVGDQDYFLCMSEDCDVTYYNESISFDKSQLQVPIWFKRDANPKWACYCSKVSEGDVIDAVVTKGATTMREVLRITGAMKNSQCQLNNPLGKCCHLIIQDAMNKGFSLKTK